MTAISFNVPGDVRGKGRPRIVRFGGSARMAADKKTVSYENLIALACSAAMRGVAPLAGPLSVRLSARFSPPKSVSRVTRAAMLAGEILPTKKPDLDNIVKCLDALNGIAWGDDAQIVSISATKHYAETPGLTISIARIGALAEAA